MRIEAIDAIRATDDPEPGEKRGRDIHLEPGDRATVGPNFGALACRMGWAKDLDEQVATGEKTREPVTVTPQNTVVEGDARA